MGFLRQEYLSVLPFPSPDLPYPGAEPTSSALANAPFTTDPPGEAQQSSITPHANIHIFQSWWPDCPAWHIW